MYLYLIIIIIIFNRIIQTLKNLSFRIFVLGYNFSLSNARERNQFEQFAISRIAILN